MPPGRKVQELKQRQLRAVNDMRTNLNSLRDKMNSEFPDDIDGLAKEILQRLAEDDNKFNELLEFVNKGLTTGLIASRLLRLIQRTLAYLAEGTTEISNIVLTLAAAMLSSVTQLLQLLTCNDDGKQLDIIDKQVEKWSDTYLGELDKTRNEIDSGIEKLHVWISETLDSAQGGVKQATWTNAMEFSGILIGLKHDYARFRKLIDAAQTQLTLLKEGAEEARKRVESGKSAGNTMRWAGGILVVVGLVTILSGGAAIPLFAASTGVAAGVAAGVVGAGVLVTAIGGGLLLRGRALKRYTISQIEKADEILQKIQDLQYKLDAYNEKAESQREQLEFLTEKLAGQLKALTDQIEENDKLRKEIKRLRDAFAQ